MQKNQDDDFGYKVDQIFVANNSSTNISTMYETIYRKRFGSKALLSRLGTVLLHFSRRSTIHGLNHLAQARSAKHRLFWLTISFCASLGFCINLFYLIEKFLQTPVLTNVFHDYNNFTYPDLTICIVNPIYFPPNNTIKYNELVNVINKFDKLTHHSRLKYSSVIGNISYPQRIELSDYLFMHRNLEYSHQSWSAIILCRYLQHECNYTHFETRHIWPYGNCFTFNGTKMGKEGTRDVKKNSFLNGWRPDFKVVIYKALEYPSTLQLDPFNDINKPSGVLVMIHEADTYPHIGESFVVDSFTQVDLKITTKSHLSTVKKCKSERSNYTYYDFKTDTSTKFVGRQGDCLFTIIQKNIARYCQCQFHKMPVLNIHKYLPFCFDMNFIHKHKNLSDCLRKSLNDVDKEEIRHLCYRDLCEHPSFTTVVSHSKYPAVGERQTHLLWLKNLKILEEREIANYNHSELFKLAIHPSNETNPHHFKSISEVYNGGRTDLLRENFINKNFMHLRFVPSSLFMDHVEETEEYPLSRLLSDIGGCVGLWVGASLITVFEFIDLLLDLGEIIRYRSQAAAAFRRQAVRLHMVPAQVQNFSENHSTPSRYRCTNNEGSPSTSNKQTKYSYYNTNIKEHKQKNIHEKENANFINLESNNIHNTTSQKIGHLLLSISRSQSLSPCTFSHLENTKPIFSSTSHSSSSLSSYINQKNKENFINLNEVYNFNDKNHEEFLAQTDIIMSV